MKYNLLPKSYTDRFDELKTDWTQMSKQKLLAEVQKCEEADKKERAKALIKKGQDFQEEKSCGWQQRVKS